MDGFHLYILYQRFNVKPSNFVKKGGKKRKKQRNEKDGIISYSEVVFSK